MRRARRPRAPRPLEKVVQVNGCNLLRSLGGAAYNVGTTRKKGDHQGTMQTAGLADVWFVLPAPRYPSVAALGAPGGVAGWWEAKRTGEERSAEQIAFGDECARTGTPYVWGDLDALLHWLIEHGYLKREQVGAHHLGGV